MAGKGLSWGQQVKMLPGNFWMANWLEINERLAFFGIRAILPLYMIYSVAENGLELSYTQKGIIYGVWALIQCLVPMVSGAFTDNYGYKKSLYVAYTINFVGYLIWAFIPEMAAASGGGLSANFWFAMLAACTIGLGTAIFKPPAQGTVAQTVKDENSSVGWGIFYWMVNIGGFLAPILAAILRGEHNWKLVFLCAAAVTAFNFIPTIFLYKEPERPASKKSLGQTGKDIVSVFTDARFVIFLAIFSGFWFMFMQLWDLLPNFIDEWVFSRDVAPMFNFMFGWLGDVTLPNGNVKPEMMINIDSFGIILLVLFVTYLSGKFHPMVSLILGMAISLVGFLMSGASNVGWMVALAIFIFAIGEMTCSPKFSEYVGLIAPPDKKALYMGYSNIPFAVGWTVGNLVSGPLYDSMGSRENFARQYLVNTLNMDPVQVAELGKDKVLETMASVMNNGAVPNQEMLDNAIRTLWDAYDPWRVWVVLTCIGLASTIGMLLFYFFTKEKKADTNAVNM